VRFLIVLPFYLAFAGCGANGAPTEGAPAPASQSQSAASTPPTASTQMFTLSDGETVTYQPGVARVGDTISCEASSGYHVRAEVPKPEQGVAGFADGTSGAASISVSTREDGSVVASCDG
jgi:hypothetical protein